MEQLKHHTDFPAIRCIIFNKHRNNYTGDNGMISDKNNEMKLFKLKRIRIIATGLLIAMALIYFVFERIETHNVFFPFISAFAEASMIGALADWSAVIALFRHPLGMTWLPHTAIIQKNKDRIGESLATFIVSNFFTKNIIKSKLNNIHFSKDILLYCRKNKNILTQKAVVNFPVVVGAFLNSSKVSETIQIELKSMLKKIEVYPLIDSILPVLILSELHIPIVHKLLDNVFQWISNNKEKTVKIIEGMNKKFAFPFVGDMIYNFIVKALSKLTEDTKNGVSTEFNKEILHNLPEKWLHDFKSSKEIRAKVESFKNDILDSDWFNNFVDEEISKSKVAIISYDYSSNEQIITKISEIFDFVLVDLLHDESIQKNLDDMIQDNIANIIFTYRQEIARLISDTVKEWPINDMANKLETEVGGDLQFIRINGTIIGGIAGLIIHAITLFFNK